MSTGIAPEHFLDPALPADKRRRVLRRVLAAMLDAMAEEGHRAQEDAFRRKIEAQL